MTQALQRKLNSKPLRIKKADTINIQRYNRLRCQVPQPPKLYGLPKLHKPGVPMRPIVSFCGSPTYQLSKHLTTILKPFTDESRHKLQSTETFIDVIKRVQVPDDHKLVSFDVKSLFTSIPLQLALDCTETAINNFNFTTATTYERPNGPTQPLPYVYRLPVQRQTLQTVAWNSYWFTSFRCGCRNRHAKHRGTIPSNLQTNDTTLATLRRRHFYSRSQRRNRRAIFTNTLTDRTPTFSSLRRSRRMVSYLF